MANVRSRIQLVAKVLQFFPRLSFLFFLRVFIRFQVTSLSSFPQRSLFIFLRRHLRVNVLRSYISRTFMTLTSFKVVRVFMGYSSSVVRRSSPTFPLLFGFLVHSFGFYYTSNIDNISAATFYSSLTRSNGFSFLHTAIFPWFFTIIQLTTHFSTFTFVSPTGYFTFTGTFSNRSAPSYDRSFTVTSA